MRIEALCRQTGPGYKVDKGDVFDVSDRNAQDLIRRKLAKPHEQPSLKYQTRVVDPVAPEVRAALPFRDLHHADERRKSELPSSRPSLLSTPDSSQPGASDPGRRTGRP